MKLLTLIIFLNFFTTGMAMGGQGGNGGGGFICPDSKDSEFLDLYEARRPAPERINFPYTIKIPARPALNIPVSSRPVENQVQAAFDRLRVNPLVYKIILETYEIVKKAKVIPPPPNTQLSWPHDAIIPYVKANCQALGIMIFHDDDLSMDQDKPSLEKLPPTDQAAAWVHETLYRFFRMTQEDSVSTRTREVVGYLFSDKSEEEVVEALVQLDFNLKVHGRPGLYVTYSYAAKETSSYYVLESIPKYREPFKFEYGQVPLHYALASTGKSTWYENCKNISDHSGDFSFNLNSEEGAHYYFAAFSAPLKLLIAKALPDLPESPCDIHVTFTDNYGNMATALYQPYVGDSRNDFTFLLPGI